VPDVSEQYAVAGTDLREEFSDLARDLDEAFAARFDGQRRRCDDFRRGATKIGQASHANYP
jgi:hypothetical protein